MDDGDILGLRPKPVVHAKDHEDRDGEDRENEDRENEDRNPNSKDPRSEFLVQHCSGAVDLNDVNSWSERNKHRYFLSTRTILPLRKKLEEFIGDSCNHDEASVDESLLVLSTLAKSFIAGKIERVRIKDGMDFTSPISKNELLERNLKGLGAMSAI